MAQLKDISTTAWQFSLQGVGFIVEGLADISQCIDIILRTQKGTDPFRPQFGSDVYDWIDRPVPVAIPNIKKAIIEAISIWETRVVVNKIEHQAVLDGASSQLIFNITYGIVDTDILDSLQLTIDGSLINTSGGATSKLILIADIPAGPRFYLQLILDGRSALPEPPLIGFSSIQDLYAWINNYWGGLGTWYNLSLQSQIVGYINAGIAQTGSLTITSPAFMLMASVPALTEGDHYEVSFTIGGVPVVPAFPSETALTQENIIVWVQQNWANYGTWIIVDNTLILTSDTVLVDAALEVVSRGGSAFSLGFSTGFTA